MKKKYNVYYDYDTAIYEFYDIKDKNGNWCFTTIRIDKNIVDEYNEIIKRKKELEDKIKKMGLISKNV